MRKRANFLKGTTDVALAAGDTSLSSPELANLPEVAAPDYLLLVLDPGTAREIVKVTAHAAGATTATIVRGWDGTTAAAHASGIEWIHAPVASDFDTVAGTAPVLKRKEANTTLAINQVDANVDTALDVTIPAQAGEMLRIEVGALISGGDWVGLTACTVVGGVAQTVVRLAGAFKQVNEYEIISPWALYTVQAADVVNGKVTLRLRYNSGASASCTIHSDAANPLLFAVTNLSRLAPAPPIDHKAEIYSSGIITTDAVFNPRPTTDTIITGLELTIPASTYERTFLVFGYVSSAQGGSSADNVRTTLYRDTTKIFNGNNDLASNGLGIYALVNEGGIEAQTLVGVPVTIPGDNAEHKISWQFNAVGSTASWTFKARYLIASLIASAGGRGAMLLGRAQKTAATDSELFSVTSTTWVELDTTNLKVTFTAPASGEVDLVLYGIQAMSAAAWCYWGVFEGGAIRADSARTPNTSTFSFAQHTRKRITGLTPGQVYTWTWAARVDSQTMSIVGGPNRGEIFMEVWSA